MSVVVPRSTNPSSSSLNLLGLPVEVRRIIYEYILPHKDSFDITVRDRKRGEIPGRFKRFVPNMKSASILLVCQKIRAEAIDFMYSSNTFTCKNSDTITKLPDLLGDLGAASTQSLDLTIHFRLKTNTLHIWISLLAFLVYKMPSLKKLTLSSDFLQDAPPMDETRGLDRVGQEKRALLRLGSYLTLRHPVLDLMIWPADSGAVKNGRKYVRVELCNLEKKPVLKTHKKRDLTGVDTMEDLIIDSTAIRRVAWTDLDTESPREFALPNSAESSETPEPSRKFMDVHRFGYLSRQERRSLGDPNPDFSVDKVIRQAEEMIRRETAAATSGKEWNNVGRSWRSNSW